MEYVVLLIFLVTLVLAAIAYVIGLWFLCAFCLLAPVVGVVLRDTKHDRWSRSLLWGPAMAGTFAVLFAGYVALAWWLGIAVSALVSHAVIFLPAGMIAGLLAGLVMAMKR